MAQLISKRFIVVGTDYDGNTLYFTCIESDEGRWDFNKDEAAWLTKKVADSIINKEFYPGCYLQHCKHEMVEY